MPLSEDEQRILSEIEQQLYEDDPALAREVSKASPFDAGFRNVRFAAVGFVAGLAALLFALSVSPWIAFGGFLVMLASAWTAERNLRAVGRIGMQQVAQNARTAGNGGRGYFGEAGQRLRNRINEGDEETS